MKTNLVPFSEEHKSDFCDWFAEPDALYRFGGTSFQFPLTKEQLSNYPAMFNAYAFALLNENGQQIGCGDFVDDAENNEARLCRIVINPEYRSQGFGKILVDELVHKAKEILPSRKISLNVLSDNETAIHLYKKYGFQETELYFSFDAGGATYKGYKMFLS